MIDNISPVEIAEGTYWVGKREEDSIFHANPYLRVFEGADEGSGQPRRFNFLIDPGSSSDFALVSQLLEGGRHFRQTLVAEPEVCSPLVAFVALAADELMPDKFVDLSQRSGMRCARCDAGTADRHALPPRLHNE